MDQYASILNKLRKSILNFIMAIYGTKIKTLKAQPIPSNIYD